MSGRISAFLFATRWNHRVGDSQIYSSRKFNIIRAAVSSSIPAATAFVDNVTFYEFSSSPRIARPHKVVESETSFYLSFEDERDQLIYCSNEQSNEDDKNSSRVSLSLNASWCNLAKSPCQTSSKWFTVMMLKIIFFTIYFSRRFRHFAFFCNISLCIWWAQWKAINELRIYTDLCARRCDVKLECVNVCQH